MQAIAFFSSVAAHDIHNRFDDGYPPLAPTAGNRRLLSIYDGASRALGFGSVVAVDPMRAGAADVSFAAPYAPSAMDAIGLQGGTITQTRRRQI